METFGLLPDGEISDAVIVGDIAWAARTETGALVAVDLSDPENPGILGSMPIDAMYETYDVDVADSLGFVTYFNFGLAGVRVFDISDPTAPTDVGDFPAPAGHWASYLAADGDYVYVSFAYDLFGVLDISVPSAPVLVGELTLDRPWKIALAGSRAFVINEGSGVAVVDITDPAAPALVDSISTTGTPNDLKIAGDLLYVATIAGLDIFDITETETPTALGHVPTPNRAAFVSVFGDVAYVSDWGQVSTIANLLVIDVRNPAAPIIKGTITGLGRPYNAYQADDSLLILNNSTFYLTAIQCPLSAAAVNPSTPEMKISLRAFPNPFNPRTVLSFNLPTAGPVTLEIFDVAGRRVRTLLDGREMGAGVQRQAWAGDDEAGRRLPSGTYYCRLQAGSWRGAQTLTLVQ
jgi:hypothetical protein